MHHSSLSVNAMAALTHLHRIEMMQAEVSRTLELESSSTSPNSDKVRTLLEQSIVNGMSEIRQIAKTAHYIRTILEKRKNAQHYQQEQHQQDQRHDDHDSCPNAITTPSNTLNTLSTRQQMQIASYVRTGNFILGQGDIWSHCLRSQSIPNGMRVGVLSDDSGPSPIWLLGEVIGFRPHVREPTYRVRDNDKHAQVDKKWEFAPWKVLPMPLLRDVPMNARKEFCKNDLVLAVWPLDNVTALYKAQVISTPSDLKNDTYELEFDDDEGRRFVSAENVAPYVYAEPV